jgi:murein DD-endopeptidase MepM/ murein hydrolase activator NlpD
MKLFAVAGTVVLAALALPVAAIGIGLAATSSTTPSTGATTITVDGYALPVPRDGLTPARLNRPHHDYPAVDVGVPQGTPLYAITTGTITIAHPSRNRCGGTVILTTPTQRWTYCHLSTIAVRNGQTVTAGTLLGTSGGTPGTPGAGRSTGPHLHLSLHINGRLHCPQPILTAIWNQDPVTTAPPTRGCVSGTF